MSGSEAAYAPLTTAQVRALTDKSYEKRKMAALEVEKLVRDSVAQNQMASVTRLIDVLAGLCRNNHNPDFRKGGMIGLAAASIALGQQKSTTYTEKLILPILDCFDDSDSRVRYFGCESLYNVVKVTKEGSLVHFNALFDALAKLAADVDQNVRSGADLLDKLVKDIVSNSKSFDASELMVLIRERIHTRNSPTRRFLVGWMSSLLSVPHIDMLPFLPEILDGLLQMLADQTQLVREQCEIVLGQFLKTIKERPQQLALKDMVNVLIVHAQSEDELVRYLSLVWLRDFLLINGRQLLPYASGYLLAILPCLAQSDSRHTRDIHDVARQVNVQLMKLTESDSQDVALEAKPELVDLQAMVDVLLEHLSHKAVQTRVAVLRWIHHLHNTMPDRLFKHLDRLFPALLKLISDTSDEVVLLDLEVLSAICSTSSTSKLQDLNLSAKVEKELLSENAFFVSFMCNLLSLFRQDTALLHERGAFIIRQLCVLLHSERVYSTLAVLLSDEKDMHFAALVVRTLSTILLTSTELYTLRRALSPLPESDESVVRLFVRLYRCWCHHPIALIALCLLARAYNHTQELVKYCGTLDITVDFLTEIDKLIQLIESPIFAYVRMDLLSATHRNALASVLYGLLMILPQTDAFHTLHRRLQCMPPLTLDEGSTKKEKKQAVEEKSLVNWDELMKHFHAVQNAHMEYRRIKHKELLRKQTDKVESM